MYLYNISDKVFYALKYRISKVQTFHQFLSGIHKNVQLLLMPFFVLFTTFREHNFLSMLITIIGDP